MNAGFVHSVAAFLERPMVEALGWSLVHFLWQGAAVAALLSLVLLALRRAGPGLRYAAACTGLLLMAACPLATLVWSWNPTGQRAFAAQPTTREVPRAEPAMASNQAVPIVDRAAAAALPAGEALPASATAPAPSRRALHAATVSWSSALRPLLQWFVAVWLAGVAALALRLCVGWLWVQRLRRRAVRPVAAEWEAALARLAARIRVSRPVTLLESALVEVPTVIGWLRPAILMPASALLGLTPRQLESILAHELAHVRRHDYLVNLVQTALETLLFYHPAVWWLSRVVRAEREACCDEIAVEVANDRLEYARALASLEELRGRPRWAVAATDGPLADRIRRLVGAPVPQANRSAWWVVAAVAAGVLAMFSMQDSPEIQAEGPNDQVADKPPEPADDWGPEANGLRCRLVAVPTSTDDEAPDATQTTDEFAHGGDVAFAVELQNVGEEPLTLLGVRYGESYPTAKGKLNTGFFGPQLFDFEFTDAAGAPLPRPAREYLEGRLEIVGASTHDLPPGESLVVLLRPSQFNSPMEHRLPPGEFRGRVRYRGPSAETLAQIAKHWPDSPQAKAWSGEATSNEVSFEVADAGEAKPAELVWGEATNGLQAAVEFRPSRGGLSPDDPPGTVPLNTVLDAVFHLKNVGEETIALVSETWRQDDHATATNEAGEEQQLGGSWYSGVAIMVRWTLRPGEVAELQASNLAIAADQAALETFEHPVGKGLIATPGKYVIRYTIRLGGIQSRDEAGNVVFPTEEDWQGELATGETTLVVRARTPADDERVRVPTFTGKIEFVGTDGRSIESGTFEVRTASQRSPATKYEVHGGPIDVPNCTDDPLMLYVRAAGYEEARFYDLTLRPDEARRIELAPAAATRFRLVSSVDGTPVAGARVRYFNKNSAKAGGGPFPMDGIEGPIWAISQADGTVLLDTLQRVDPYYEDLGDAMYYFYIEMLELAPRFLGPVRAGQDLEDVSLGPYLEVRGEVRGTPDELDRFAAEWDQPFELTTDNPDASWLYAVSQKLETQREGDKLTFHLTGLRPGKLRIVANFTTRDGVAHTYGRRDPTGSDIVVEAELTDSVLDFIVAPESGKPAEEEAE